MHLVHFVHIWNLVIIKHSHLLEWVKSPHESLIQQNNNNLTKTWSIIKSVISNKKSLSKCSKLVNDNITMSDNLEIAYFNNYFVKMALN